MSSEGEAPLHKVTPWLAVSFILDFWVVVVAFILAVSPQRRGRGWGLFSQVPQENSQEVLHEAPNGVVGGSIKVFQELPLTSISS